MTFIIDSNNDTSHLLSSLSPETREHLCVLLRADPKWLSARRNGINLEVDGSLEGSKLKFLGQEVSEPPIIADGESTLAQEVEIPLFADSEFFRILKGELSALHDLQEQEQKDLDSQVSLLREAIAKATSSSFRRSRRALYAWRDIFRLYMEAQVFFSTDELHSGERTSAVAQQQLVKFQNALSKDSRCKKMGKDGRAALESFMSLNYILLQNLKFQEINRIALRKILKKFDKRTALRAYPAIPLLESLLARNVSKVLCQTISQEILSIVPQLSDYLCPICLNIAFKPVRLRCHHVFCIRCLVIMQRAQQNQCALCRSEVVMEATSGEFLYFQRMIP